MDEKPLIDKLDEAIKNRMQQKPETPKASDMMEALKYFVSIDGIYGKTKITTAQRNMLYTYEIMSKKHPKWKLSDAAQKLAQLLISQDGESRKGMIDLFRGLLSQMRQESVSLEMSRNSENPPKK